MTRLILIVITGLYSSAIFAQEADYAILPTAFEFVQDFRHQAVEDGEVKEKHAVVIDGIFISDSTVLAIGLKDLNMSAIEIFKIFDHEKAKIEFDGEIARNGIILILLTKKANKKFARNIKRYERKSAANNASNAMAQVLYSDISPLLTTFSLVDRYAGGKLATAVYA